MEWHSHETSRDTACRLSPGLKVWTREQCYANVAGFDPRSLDEREWKYQSMLEFVWEKNHRPFYNVWPSVVEGLGRLRLQLPCSSIATAVARMPRAVCLRFARGHELRCGPHRLASILVGKIVVPLGFEERDDAGLAFLCDAGERNSGSVPVYWNIRFSLGRAKTVEEELASLPMRLNAEESATTWAAVRTYLSLALMRGDPTLVDAVVLKRDEREYDETRSKDLVAKARARGTRRGSLPPGPQYRMPKWGPR